MSQNRSPKEGQDGVRYENEKEIVKGYHKSTV